MLDRLGNIKTDWEIPLEFVATRRSSTIDLRKSCDFGKRLCVSRRLALVSVYVGGVGEETFVQRWTRPAESLLGKELNSLMARCSIQLFR